MCPSLDLTVTLAHRAISFVASRSSIAGAPLIRAEFRLATRDAPAPISATRPRTRAVKLPRVSFAASPFEYPLCERWRDARKGSEFRNDRNRGAPVEMVIQARPNDVFVELRRGLRGGGEEQRRRGGPL